MGRRFCSCSPAASLPVDGLLDHLDPAIVARADGRVVGCAALEVYPDGALLRSVAVDAAARGQGIGTLVTTAALDLARARDAGGLPADDHGRRILPEVRLLADRPV